MSRDAMMSGVKPESVLGKFRLIDHPLAQHKLSLIREDTCSTSNFRRLVTELGLILAYEASREINIQSMFAANNKQIESGKIDNKKIAIVPIVRSGLPMAEGALQIIPFARVGHMGFRRTKNGSLEEHLVFLPDPLERHFMIMDTEIGSGKTASFAVDVLKEANVRQENISICTILITEVGLKYVMKIHDGVSIYAVSSKDKLDGKGHIVPGLPDDANNKMFGIW